MNAQDASEATKWLHMWVHSEVEHVQPSHAMPCTYVRTSRESFLRPKPPHCRFRETLGFRIHCAWLRSSVSWWIIERPDRTSGPTVSSIDTPPSHQRLPTNHFHPFVPVPTHASLTTHFYVVMAL